jgi:hypothetical protein
MSEIQVSGTASQYCRIVRPGPSTERMLTVCALLSVLFLRLGMVESGRLKKPDHLGLGGGQAGKVECECGRLFMQ